MTCWSPLHGGLLSGKYTTDSVDPSIPNRVLPHVKDSSQFWYQATQRNLAILKEFNEAGLDFAFPTQTLIHDGLPGA